MASIYPLTLDYPTTKGTINVVFDRRLTFGWATRTEADQQRFLALAAAERLRLRAVWAKQVELMLATPSSESDVPAT